MRRSALRRSETGAAGPAVTPIPTVSEYVLAALAMLMLLAAASPLRARRGTRRYSRARRLIQEPDILSGSWYFCRGRKCTAALRLTPAKVV